MPTRPGSGGPPAAGTPGRDDRPDRRSRGGGVPTSLATVPIAPISRKFRGVFLRTSRRSPLSLRPRITPGAIATVAYDATALAAALARAGATFEPEAIGNRGGFLGADGLFRFDDEGIAERGLAIFEVASGGETRIVSPAPARFAADEPGPEGG